MIQLQSFTGGAFGENTWLGWDDASSAAFLVDPGAAAPKALATIREKGLTLETVLLTHAHLDHIEGLAAVRRESPAPIHMHPFDRPLFDAAMQQAAAFGIEMEPPPPPDAELAHDQMLVVPGGELLVKHAPGHAPGHVIFFSPEDDMALVGDVIFLGSIGRTDLPGGDFQTLIASIRKEILSLPDSTALHTGHGPSTQVLHERRGNPFLIPQYGGELA